jgi:YD repeat-containing protein
MSKTEPIREYDSKGKLIHYRGSNGFEYWYEYDTNGNEIHYRNSGGYETWCEYDTNGNRIHYRSSNGLEQWYEYDTNGKCIHYKDGKGYEEWYDSDGNHHRNKDDWIRRNATIAIIDDIQEMSIEELNRLKEWINKEFM